MQYQNSFFYVGLFNTVMLAVTLWYTAGYEIAQRYLPWFGLWMFILTGVALWHLMIAFDYKFFYPVRQRFLNVQACKHENPAMDELRAIRKEIAELKEYVMGEE